MPGTRSTLIFACAGLALLGSPAPVPAADRQGWDMIAFEMRSWGRPIASWIIGRDGGGSWVETVSLPGAPFSRYRLVIHEVKPDPAAHAALLKTLSQLPASAPDSTECRNMMTDMPYGTLRLTKAATTTEIAWNSGCQDPAYERFLDVLKAADQAVTARGKAGRTLRTEEVGGPAGSPQG